MFNPETPPELAVSRWLNAREPLSLAALKGRVVVVIAFQMLCPGCVEHALPQARRLAERFNPAQVAIIGLHTVFEHHAVMTPAALEVFVHEYRLPFPVGIDQPDGERPPVTFSAYQMQGTPTLLVFDREGRLRRHYFGRPDDIMLAAEIMAMAIEEKGAPREAAAHIERRIAATLVAGAHADGEHAHDHGHAHHGHDHGDACGCEHHDHHDHGHAGHQHGRHAHGATEPNTGAAPSESVDRLVSAERMTEPPRDIGRRGSP